MFGIRKKYQIETSKNVYLKQQFTNSRPLTFFGYNLEYQTKTLQKNVC
jgi:hypothetical protein